MAEKIPGEVFRNTPLRETPQALVKRPGRDTVIRTYNTVFERLMTRGAALEQDLRDGRFNGLAKVSERTANGTMTPDDQTLIDDFRTLLNARMTSHGRSNLNTADCVLVINEQEASGRTLTSEQIMLREGYQAGDFHLISEVYHPLSDKIRCDRFTVPARDGDKDFAIIDGAPVEGLLTLIDEEISQTFSNQSLTAGQRQGSLNRLRYERDVLFTQSTPIFASVSEVTHARNQLEAYFNFLDDLRREWILPDWLNGENLLQDRRVLNIPQQPRGRRRWPFILPLLFLPFVNITTSPCQGTGGNLRTEVFDPSKVESVSLRGANERELGYFLTNMDQSIYRPSDDPDLRGSVDKIVSDDPEFYEEYLRIAEQDEVQTGQRIRSDQDPTPWLNGTDFEGQRKVLASCLSAEQRSEKAKENIERRKHPRWYDGTLNFLEKAYQAIPKINITLR